MDVVVIGGGIVGAATTYRLARLGARVTLLDAGEPGRGTSASSFAWLNSANKEPRPYHDLNVAGIAAHAALAAEFDAAPWYHPDGALEWATGAAGDDHLRRKAERLRAWDYPVEELDPERAVRELEPGLALDPRVVPAVWYRPGEGWVDGPVLVRALLRAAAGRGATVRAHAAVAAFEREGGRIAAVRLAGDERLPADVVINCTGPRAAEVAALAGVAVPLRREAGLLAVTGAVGPRPRRVCHAPGIDFRPDPGGGLVLAHAPDFDRTVTEETPADPPPPACAELLKRAARFYPDAARAGLAAARIGVRPLPADGVAIAGRAPECANFWVAVTHSGVTLGPLLGRLIAEEVASGQAPAMLAPFRPDRFSAPAGRGNPVA